MRNLTSWTSPRAGKHPMNTPNPIDVALMIGATVRLTHLVTHDDMPGQWLIKDPLNNLAFAKSLEQGHDVPWRKYLDGLECPHCVGQWVAFGVLGVTTATKGTRLERPWRWMMAGLALNAAAVMVGSVTDYWDRPEDADE